MNYRETYHLLKNIESYDRNEIEINENLIMRNFSFESNYRFILPGGSGNNDDYEYISHDDSEYEPDVIQEMLNKKDAEIPENLSFRYHVISPKNQRKITNAILMFHGFNEKYWAKYLPWAAYIVEKTGKSVILFPIAFHMNRAPSAWSDSREMYTVSAKRKQRHPNVINSSLSNVAISTRLHNKPQRFIWSGLQTYYDIIDFISDVRQELHPIITPHATFDIMSYSIGSFLGEILMMTNEKDYFSESKFVLFCGGAVFNRLSPVSKFILDSEANVSLYSFVVEHLESHMKRDEVLGHYLGDTHPEGINFRSMLNYKTLTKYREDKYRSLSNRIFAVTLADDNVVPAYEVINTLQGVRRDIPIPVEVLDFPYKYKHEDPFPAIENIQEEVDRAFKQTFDLIVNYLG